MQRERSVVVVVMMTAALAAMSGLAGAQEYMIEVEELAALPFENFSIPAEEVYDDSIYFFGGYHGSFPVIANDGIRRFDLVSGQFETLQLTLPFGMGQNAVTSARIEGSFYLPPGFATGDWGGWGSHKRFLEVDLEAETSQELYPLPNVSRVWGVGSTTANGRVYFFGGWNGAFRSEISEYDPVTDSFTHVTNMARGLAPVHAIQAEDGWIYYWGSGNAWPRGIERFNPQSGAVEPLLTSGHTWFEGPYVFWYLPDEEAILMLEGWAPGMTTRRLARFSLASGTFEDTGVGFNEELSNQRATRDPDDPAVIYAYLRREMPGGVDKVLTRLTLRSPNEAPFADAGPDQWLIANDQCEGEAQLVGSGSFDPDGDPLTFTWMAAALGTIEGEVVTAQLPLGVTAVGLSVSDGRGGVGTDEVVITVEDGAPPELFEVHASPSVLWPPNHKMRRVTVSLTTTDACDPAPVCSITGVTSNEPVSGPGSGNTDPDWCIVGPLEVDLRAERSGGGTGRIYCLEVACTDTAGNTQSELVEVVVPHNQGS